MKTCDYCKGQFPGLVTVNLDSGKEFACKTCYKELYGDLQ